MEKNKYCINCRRDRPYVGWKKVLVGDSRRYIERCPVCIERTKERTITTKEAANVLKCS